MGKKQITICIDEDIYNEIIEIKKDTGLSMGQIVSLKLKGFDVKKVG